MPTPTNPVVVQSASDINSSNTGVTYLIVGDITGDVTLGANCTLIFQGGKFVSGTVTGDCTTIEAPLNVIFGASAVIAGTWRVPTAYPEWFEAGTVTVAKEAGGTETVADDATRINKAFRLLMPATGLPRPQDVGGTLQLSGKYHIFSTVVVPRLVNLVGTNGYLSQIILPDPAVYTTGDLFKYTVVRTQTQGSHEIEAAVYYQNTTYDNNGLNKATGGRDFSVYLNGNSCHGLYVERAYDQAVWENVEVYGTDASHHAFHFTTNDDADSHVSQTLLLLNCIGYRSVSYSSPSEGVPVDVTPVFYFWRCQEVNIIGCKAFATSDRGSGIAGGSAFQLDNCRGVLMDGCSAGFGHTGVLITATSRNVAGFTITGLTCEGVSAYDVDARANASLTVASLTLLPVRHEAPSSGHIRLNRCADSYVVSTLPGQRVIMENSGTCNHVVSAMPVVVPDGEGVLEERVPRGNACTVLPNYNDNYGLTMQDRMRVDGELAVTGQARVGGMLNADSGMTMGNGCKIAPNGNNGEVWLGTSRRVSVMPSGVRLENIPASTGGFTVKDDNDNIIFQSISSIASGSTGLNIWAHNGTKKTLRMHLGRIEANGDRHLVIKDNDPISTSGTVASVPTSSLRLYPGFFYYASDLGKPIWYTGSGWVDADGNQIV